MRYNKFTDSIYCYGCNKWIKWREQAYCIDGLEGRWCCLECDYIVGYSWDFLQIL